jgi:hypothetical protein
MVQNQPGQIVLKTLSQKTLSQKIGLVDWLKVKALKKKKEHAWWHTPVMLALRRLRQED